MYNRRCCTELLNYIVKIIVASRRLNEIVFSILGSDHVINKINRASCHFYFILFYHDARILAQNCI